MALVSKEYAESRIKDVEYIYRNKLVICVITTVDDDLIVGDCDFKNRGTLERSRKLSFSQAFRSMRHRETHRLFVESERGK
ncbi:hypothetical protein H0A36_28300 [Endozoicomonas sp. SM1973]|uniref:Uncharacterized protein n=1 Tax=Spartinivicinus marinus TaxID=2994442 RepID=A0A853I7N2_9GAMM|nr:hypothetical protein [Spartinivicinus marinus]MCX4025655.1 hypothetical protein [Spartinivicinus marinus]NYZ69920.1 hypothetical protein [Spartinivicinus marinus]